MPSFNPIQIALDPIGAFDAIFDISGNQDRQQQSLDMANVQHQQSMQLAWDQARHQYFQDDWARRQYENRFTNIAKQANKAGISTLAALGLPGTTPTSSVGTAIPQAQPPGYVHNDLSGITKATIKLGALQQAADINRTVKTTPQDNRNMRGEAYLPDVPVDNEGTSTSGITTLTSKYRTPGGNTMRGPSQNFPDIDQWLIWSAFEAVKDIEIGLGVSDIGISQQGKYDKRVRGRDWSTTQEDIAP